MYISIPVTIFYFVIGYVCGVASTILFGHYLVKKQEKQAIEKSRKLMQKIVDSEKDKEDKK